MFQRFGWWESHADWLAFVKLSGPEFARALKPAGRLRYKMTSYNRKGRPQRSDIDSMPFKVETERTTVSKSHLSQRNTVHWLTMTPTHPTPEAASP